MAVMFGSVDGEGNPVVDTASTSIIKTVRASEIVGTNQVVINGTTVTATDIVYYTATGSSTESSTDAAYATFHYTPAEAHTITISAETFPGTYYVTGDTYARSEINGLDDFFQFIIPKAKVLSEVTLTMEAEGDPSTFTMNLKVLRPSDGKMMKLVRYAI